MSDRLDQFPPLSSYASKSPSALDDVTANLEATSIAGASSSASVSTASGVAKNKKKNKKKGKK